MKILSVTSEIYPLIKTGGLADVAGALPPALAGNGAEVRTLVPGYPVIMARLGKSAVRIKKTTVLGRKITLLSANTDGLELIILDAPELFDRPGGPYSDETGKDHADNWLRFAVLSRAAADIAAGLIPGWVPDLVHAHDWQAAMASAYLHYSGQACPSVVTIHNLAFQGHFPEAVFDELGLPADAFMMDGVEYYGGVGFLKGGLQFASAVTTVSPTYASEITTPEFGMGLDGLVRMRHADLHGIVNGIDTDVWNPGTDPLLKSRYDSDDLAPRRDNRLEVERMFGLDSDPSPIFAVISRLTWQKGIDLLAGSAGTLVKAGAKLAVLGSGDAALEGRFLALASQHRGRVGTIIGYNEPLSHLLQGGADGILIPSRFEPCGLTQLYGLRYGCIPVVARTGGLADTVINANTAALNAGVATGITHTPDSSDALVSAIQTAVSLYHSPGTWAAMQRQGMQADVSWDRSAAAYTRLYSNLIHKKSSSS